MIEAKNSPAIANQPSAESATGRPRIEQHTIYQIPLDQRHGKARHLFTLWFGANINVLTVVTGALATTLFGQSFLSGSVAILVGNLVGTIFMALHAAQGPRLGVPQMVQSRGQFGARGRRVRRCAGRLHVRGICRDRAW